MTHSPTLTMLEAFRLRMEQLSQDSQIHQEFWPAYAEAANELEAASPLDVRDDVRHAMVQTISRARPQATDDAPS